jgi:hypothetical protein
MISTFGLAGFYSVDPTSESRAAKRPRARGIRIFIICLPFVSSRFLEPPIECFKKLTHFLGFLIPSREVVSLSLVFFQTIEFRLVLLHGMDEWN